MRSTSMLIILVLPCRSTPLLLRSQSLIFALCVGQDLLMHGM